MSTNNGTGCCFITRVFRCLVGKRPGAQEGGKGAVNRNIRDELRDFLGGTQGWRGVYPTKSRGFVEPFQIGAVHEHIHSKKGTTIWSEPNLMDFVNEEEKRMLGAIMAVMPKQCRRWLSQFGATNVGLFAEVKVAEVLVEGKTHTALDMFADVRELRKVRTSNWSVVDAIVEKYKVQIRQTMERAIAAEMGEPDWSEIPTNIVVLTGLEYVDLIATGKVAWHVGATVPVAEVVDIGATAKKVTADATMVEDGLALVHALPYRVHPRSDNARPPHHPTGWDDDTTEAPSEVEVVTTEGTDHAGRSQLQTLEKITEMAVHVVARTLRIPDRVLPYIDYTHECEPTRSKPSNVHKVQLRGPPECAPEEVAYDSFMIEVSPNTPSKGCMRGFMSFDSSESTFSDSADLVSADEDNWEIGGRTDLGLEESFGPCFKLTRPFGDRS